MEQGLICRFSTFRFSYTRNTTMRAISLFVFKICGWRFIGESTKEMQKCVMAVAPHTSVWDFVWGRLGLWVLQLNAKFLIKKEFFSFPFGGLLKKLGGIPVDRGKRNNLVETAVEMFRKSKKLTIVITPEATRHLTHRWKKGFYEIALKANVPIVMAFVDYEKKEAGVGPIIYPTGNYEEDLKKMEAFYMNVGAKYPDNFNLSKMYREKE